MTYQTANRQRSAVAGSPGAENLITGEELVALGDIGRIEMVKGEIIQLMPTGHPHGYIEVVIAALLFNFVKLHKLGLLPFSPGP